MATPAKRSARKPLPQPRSLAPALQRGIQILELLANSPQGLSLSDIAANLHIAKSSAFGLCTTLLERDFIQRASDGTFSIGVRIMDLASARLGNSDITMEFHAATKLLGKFREQTAILSVLEGSDVLYIACRNSPDPLGITFRIGMRLPACCTATGKALLATLSNEDVRSLYKHRDITVLTRFGVTSIDALLIQLEDVRSAGYSVDDGETREHMYSVGAPVLEHTGRALAAVAVSFYRADVSPKEMKEIPRAVRAFADRLSRSQGIGHHR